MNLNINQLLFAKPASEVETFNVLRGDSRPVDHYSEVNLCDYTGDDPLHVVQSRLALCQRLHIGLDHLVMPCQTHSTHVAVVDAHFMQLDYGQRVGQLQDVDALVTSMTNVCIGVNTADCVNIVLYEPVLGIIGVAHAGWKGSAGRIAAATVETMCQLGGSRHEILATMGASICQDCFEVGDEVLDYFNERGFDPQVISRRNPATGKAHISLQLANQVVLQEAGVRSQHILWNGECTRCRPDTYFSARHMGINSGRTFTGIILRKKPCIHPNNYLYSSN